MARKAGVPEGFSLKGMGIEKPETDIETVDVGDFLEEETRATAPKVSDVQTKKIKQTDPESKTEITEPSESQPQSSIRTAKRTRVPHRLRTPQVSIREETHERLRELVDLMVRYGPQPDLKGSEVLDALINALYDARKDLEMQGVSRRGQWGSPTADAFLIQVKEAVIRTIEKYADSRR